MHVMGMSRCAAFKGLARAPGLPASPADLSCAVMHPHQAAQPSDYRAVGKRPPGRDADLPDAGRNFNALGPPGVPIYVTHISLCDPAGRASIDGQAPNMKLLVNKAFRRRHPRESPLPSNGHQPPAPSQEDPVPRSWTRRASLPSASMQMWFARTC
ncbi:uncharacterized protein VTP21DRAFT_8552 [Calcarisporiella thermophila]|uniref:uncharacterized protein n=1 Tax=Calcarisporiella thermophila TaxID=911321 RepID=UPI0037441D64